jgi:hypothetical protein
MGRTHLDVAQDLRNLAAELESRFDSSHLLDYIGKLEPLAKELAALCGWKEPTPTPTAPPPEAAAPAPVTPEPSTSAEAPPA